MLVGSYSWAAAEVITSVDLPIFYLTDKQWFLTIQRGPTQHGDGQDRWAWWGPSYLELSTPLGLWEATNASLLLHSSHSLSLPPPPLLAGFLLALLSVDYWLIPPSPIGTTQGVRTRAQRGDFHTMIWITEAFYVWSLIFPPFALLGNHHRVPFIAYGFPSRNLRLHAQTRNVFPL